MRRHRWKLGTRLILAEGLVLTAAISTAAVIAATVGPPLFHEHMRRADHPLDPSQRMHVDAAYGTASAISLSIAAAAALAISLAVSWYLTRRLQGPLDVLTRAASEMSAGRYGTRVPLADSGPEIDALASAFNSMADRLAQTEDTRRRLLSDLAHEMRTPITTLAANLDALDDGIRHWDTETVGVLRDQVGRLGRLAEDLSAVSRAEEGRLDLEPRPESVTSLVVAAVSSHLEAYRNKGVTLTSTTDPDVMVRADRLRIQQVLSNLLDNALRHTPPGGQVTVSSHVYGPDVEIRVTDTGTGISSTTLPHVFERFYRGDTARDRQHQGSGIGLTISQAIAAAHGGTLEAESGGPGTGATFRLTLPLLMKGL